MDDEQGIVQDTVEETAQADLGAQDEFAELREHYEAGTLSDEELDTIADTAITYIREMLAFFGENKVTVDEYEAVSVDIEGYKSRRKNKIQQMARQAADRARKQGRVTLAPMNAFERRIVHLALLDSLDVTTHSEGVDPERRVVVTYVRS